MEYRVKKCFLVIVLCYLAIFNSPLFSEEISDSTVFDISGTWLTVLEPPRDNYREYLKIKQDGTRITGGHIAETNLGVHKTPLNGEINQEGKITISMNIVNVGLVRLLLSVSQNQNELTGTYRHPKASGSAKYVKR